MISASKMTKQSMFKSQFSKLHSFDWIFISIQNKVAVNRRHFAYKTDATWREKKKKKLKIGTRGGHHFEQNGVFLAVLFVSVKIDLQCNFELELAKSDDGQTGPEGINLKPHFMNLLNILFSFLT